MIASSHTVLHLGTLSSKDWTYCIPKKNFKEDLMWVRFSVIVTSMKALKPSF